MGWEKVDRNDPYYKACLGGSVAGGALVGDIVGAFGTPVTAGQSLWAGPLAGAAFGFVAGYLACPYLAASARAKLKQQNMPLDDFALHQAVDAMQKYSGVTNSHDALKLVALVRKAPARKHGAQTCSAPQATAQRLVRQMTSYT